MRVVFDANVLVAALVFPGGKADQALGIVIAGADRLVISVPITHEVLAVLARKLGRDLGQWSFPDSGEQLCARVDPVRRGGGQGTVRHSLPIRRSTFAGFRTVRPNGKTNRELTPRGPARLR